MPRKRKKKTVAPATPWAWGLEAVRPDPSGLLSWPTLDPVQEVGQWDLERLYRAARALSFNSPPVRRAIDVTVNLMGWLLPQPATPDAEWNKRAREHFMRHAMNPSLFDSAGVLNFVTAQLWLEYFRAVDGDALVVSTEWDGRPCFSFFRAPQVSENGYGGGESMGVVRNYRGRALLYRVFNYATGRVFHVPAASAWLYRHNPDPGHPRGVTDLVGGIVTARDEMEINGFIKALAKLQASIGLVETKRDNDKAPGLMSQFADVMKPVSGMSPAESTMLGMSFGGSKVVSLAPGRDVKAITDNRPGPNTLQFLATQHKRVDDSLGLSNAVADDSSKLTSASTRLELDMLKRWIDKRQHWKKPMLHWIYRYFMAAEIAAGRLDPPREGNFEAVYWVPCRDLSIDVGRLASAAVNLMREGVMSRRQYTLATEGRTPEEIAAENAELFAHYAELEQLHGLAPGSLRQSALGATDVGTPQPDNSEQNNIEK